MKILMIFLALISVKNSAFADSFATCVTNRTQGYKDHFGITHQIDARKVKVPGSFAIKTGGQTRYSVETSEETGTLYLMVKVETNFGNNQLSARNYSSGTETRVSASVGLTANSRGSSAMKDDYYITECQQAE